jgi:hypothetical protein
LLQRELKTVKADKKTGAKRPFFYCAIRFNRVDTADQYE